MAQQLASHFQTCHVPEYAKIHIETRKRELAYDDMEMIARGQISSENAIALNANRVLFSDTDLLTTTIWSHWLFGDCADWIETEAKDQQFDLYLVLDVDVPWIDDTHRYLPNERNSFLAKCIETLETNDRNYVVIRGDWDQRLAKAIQEVEKLLTAQRSVN